MSFTSLIRPRLYNYRNVADSFQCHWAGCGKKLQSQQALVDHIEKNHVDLRKSEEFVCMWQPCPRQTKPFNARYKLLIHMRVHSGEKPNKCPVRKRIIPRYQHGYLKNNTLFASVIKSLLEGLCLTIENSVYSLQDARKHFRDWKI